MAKKTHPLVAAWNGDRSKGLRRGLHNANIASARAASRIDDRRHALVSDICWELERLEATPLVQADGSLAASFGGQTVEFSLVERLRQTKLPLTPLQQRYPQAAPERGYNTRLEPTGVLVFRIESYVPGFRSQRRENAGMPMERMVKEIADDLVSACRLMAAEALVEAEEKERRLRATRLREQKERAARREQQLWQALADRSRQRTDISAIRGLAATIRSAPDYDPSQPAGDRTVGEWIEWIEACLTERDPLGAGVAAFFSALAADSDADPEWAETSGGQP